MKLIIINGPNGVGKSTVATLLHKQMPGAFLLDIDQQRRFVSSYRTLAEESRILSMEVAIAILETCFKRGHDVIVVRMFYGHIEKGRKTNFLDNFVRLGKKYGAEVFEFILWAPKKVVRTRVEKRGWRQGGLLTPDKWERHWKKMSAFKKQRKQATVIQTNQLTLLQVVSKLQKCVGKQP